MFSNLRHNKRLSRFTLRAKTKLARSAVAAVLPGARHREDRQSGALDMKSRRMRAGRPRGDNSDGNSVRMGRATQPALRFPS